MIALLTLPEQAPKRLHGLAAELVRILAAQAEVINAMPSGFGVIEIHVGPRDLELRLPGPNTRIRRES